MKPTYLLRLSVSILLFLSVFTSRGEYNGYHLKYSIETTDGEVIEGYNYIAAAYFDLDSADNMGYLIRRLSAPRFTYPLFDSIHFFTDRLMYEYQYEWDTGTYRIYSVLNSTGIPSQNVKSIVITEVINQTYLTDIYNTLIMADTVWMRNKPQSVKIYDGYLCFYEVFVHQKSKITEEVALEVETLLAEHKSKMEKLEEDMKYSNGQERIDFEDQIDDLLDAIDEQLGEIISKLEGQKVVVLGTCTC